MIHNLEVPNNRHYRTIGSKEGLRWTGHRQSVWQRVRRSICVSANLSVQEITKLRPIHQPPI